MDWRLFNIVFLGLSFMLIFTAFQTCGMIEQRVVDGAKKEPNSTFTGDGYTSLAIIYLTFAGANWAAPSIVAVCGPKISMVMGGAAYLLFIVSFLKPMTWALYTGSVLIGIGAAIIWTAQGCFLTLNSDSETIARNSGIFWALMQCSLLFGNLYVYFAFKGKEEVDANTRTTLFIVLSSACLVGILMLFVLRRLPSNETDNLLSIGASTNTDSDSPSTSGPLYALKRSFELFRTKEILLLSVCYAYTGFELTFFSGVYGTSVGHTQHFGIEANSIIGLIGIFIGVGEILGGAAFGLFGKRTNKFGRDPIVLLGFIVHMAAFYLIFINLPEDSPLNETSGHTYMTSNKYVAIGCGFLLGLGDSSFNTQIYSVLGFMFPEDSAPAFALYKFVQSVTAAVAFFYSTKLLLQWQLLILVVMNVLGTMCFFLVEWGSARVSHEGYSKIE
ncbi:unnamed protein product [Owenia fusiformis]|uniref:UNC93-like protein MFSD11 n=1 Tax=Owenia fusiformis TaxID=6347 RepID=A0A8J1ULL0_OWEFU|nr:unnamed protein product [Owenia fusiformis]